MKIFDGYLMIFDMDGTLLNSRREVTEKNMEALKRWRELGGELCIASGRSAASLRQFYELLDCRLPVICGNGSGIYDYEKDEFLYKIDLPDGGRELAAAADELLPHSGITIYKDGNVYFCKENDATRRNMRNENLPYLTADYRTLPYPWEKILFSQEAEHTEKVHNLMERIADRKVFRLLKSAPVYYEILNPKASKGEALKRYCELFGYDLSRTVAVGDNENDVSMLEIAGYSFTVANCTPAARAVAGTVVCGNDYDCAVAVLEEMERMRS
ncbi:MAG: HAD family hydrolase [Clostridia bacterium]